MLLTVIAALAFVTAAWWILRPVADPVYQGQRLSVWFNQYQQARTREQSEEASEAIRRLGSAAVPFLIDRLRARDSNWRQKYVELYFSRAPRWPRWITSRLPTPRHDTSDMTRMNAVTALGWLGDAAKPAAPELARVLGEERSQISFSAGQVLKALGPSARETLPTVIASLRATNHYVAINAAGVVVSMARDSPDVIPLLTRMLGERDAVKIRILQLLTRLGHPATIAERDIESMLTSTNGSVRFAAVAALWDIFPRRHIELLSKLEEFARSPDKNIRESVGAMLARMEPLTERAAGMLTIVVREGSEGFCWSAFTILGKRGQEASNAIPVLIEGLKVKEPRAAAKAAAMLGEIARPDKETFNALEKAREHEHLMVREAAEEAIRKIQSRPD